ncbi:MAG: hypothetical protein IT458_11490 [Planctomycetes bacterium]|nr:hypothetical protein [Planctomycetota bacterium]
MRDDDRVRQELVHFALPGALHGLGNQIFLLGGRVATLGGDAAELARGRAEAQRVLEQVRGTLEVLRLLGCEPAARAERQPAATLLARLVEVLRIPLRERGLRAELRAATGAAPAPVDAARFAGVLVHALLRTLARVPQGYQGTAVFELRAADGGCAEVCVAVRAEASQLPFPIPFELVAAELAQTWGDEEVRFARLADGCGLSCRLPGGDPGATGAAGAAT